MPWKVAKQFFSRHAAIKVALPLSGSELAWMWRWFRACKADTYLANRGQLQRLAFYSRERLHQITSDLQLDYDRSDGYMVMLRSEADRKMVQMSLQVLRDAGVSFSELDSADARKLEPALNPDTEFAGAIHLPADEVGNCRQFALMLKNECLRRGVKFCFNTTVKPLERAAPSRLMIEGDPEPRAFEAVAVCAGVTCAPLLRPLGLKVPLAAVYGYSISASIREPLNAPRSAIMDERYKVAISRLGNRIRVAGSAEIGGSPGRHRASSIQTLYKVLHDWFPGAATQSSGVQVWKGARPMLPDGPPLVGAGGAPGVWLNLGHGSSGWALSCGSARALADLMGGRTPSVSLQGMDPGRLTR
jgi:D-amino-acid dehydrogenase